MAAPRSAQPNNHLLNGQAVLLAAALLLPGLVPSLFGWLTGLLATPVFLLLTFNGQNKGALLIRNGVLLAAAAAIALKLLPSLLFALTLVPLGFSFSKSYAGGDDEIRTGMRGAAILAASWLLFWTAYGTIQDLNPYQHLLEILDTGFAQTYEYYSKNSDLPAENILQLELAVNELRRLIPVILPAILCCTVLITVWINLIFSASLLARFQPAETVWKRYSHWRLPDKLVWIFIGAGIILLLGHGKLGQAALAFFLTATLLYFFQGLAVFIHMLDKWNVPVYLRILIYGILILQSFGLVLLTLLGLADVWFDFRRLQSIDNPDGN
ncbi:MAG: YybS family protein [Desulfobulbaceae bacterium]|nr:YybS family protein [Desulfobulbaceae bacterium]